MNASARLTVARLLAAALLALSLAGCASQAVQPDQAHPQDPWEGFNRGVFNFNQSFDQAIARPVARGYDRVMPDPAQRGVRNFFSNIRAPVDMINFLLQGRPGKAAAKFMRFTVNSTFGLGGLFDVATPGGVPDYRTDFGQTFATWGWKDSRYLMLPFLGPSTVRDGLGRIPDAYSNIAWRYVLDETSYALILVDGIQTRHALLPLDDDLRSAWDPYVFMRDAWLQRRAHLISGGEDELPDYDAFLDELEDWDDWED